VEIHTRGTAGNWRPSAGRCT